MCVTDWLCDRMKRLGYVQKLDKSAMPNVVKNIEPRGREPGLRPQPRVLGAVAVGQVLLIYRKDKTGGDLTSVNDLFDPKFKGKVTMLTEMRDTVGLGAARRGHRAREGDARPGDDRDRQDREGLEGRADPPLHRQRVHHATSLKGDSVAILGWSGDAVALHRRTTRTSSTASPRRAS